MTIPEGREEYIADVNPVTARGVSFLEDEFQDALMMGVVPMLKDEAGRHELEELLGDLSSTEFDTQSLEGILAAPLSMEDWRVGEALAEAYLGDHRNCHFPWPGGRDLKNPSASPAGADLVGFHLRPDGTRFAFGEVKTSSEKKYPPGVVYGRSGIQRQLEDLRNSRSVKQALVRYLGFRARSRSWENNYKVAAARYVKDPTDVSLFGVLVRDVLPHPNDLAARASALAGGCPILTSIDLLALYIPGASLVNLGDHLAGRLEAGQ